MARKKGGGHGGHGWFVTFADLMALLMSFFVMVAAYSTQDQKKLQLVAGSMRDAFGSTKESRYAGIVEQDGIPVRSRLSAPRVTSPDEATDHPTSVPQSAGAEGKSQWEKTPSYLSAAASLRQALQELPDISEISKNVIVEETKQGLDVSIVDQDGRSMFGTGSTQPYDRTRRLIEAVAPTLRSFSQRISITGHTSAMRPGQRPEGPPWELSTGRAVTVHDILSGKGVPDDRFAVVAGKADAEPMFPDNPYLAANRRVTITLLSESPAVPFAIKP